MRDNTVFLTQVPTMNYLGRTKAKLNQIVNFAQFFENFLGS